MKIATDLNIKQNNSTDFLRLWEIGGSCPCRGFTLTQASPWTRYHSSISANLRTKWGKREQFSASSIFFLINLYCPGKTGKREPAHALRSSGGWQDLSGNPQREGHAPGAAWPGAAQKARSCFPASLASARSPPTIPLHFSYGDVNLKKKNKPHLPCW